MESFVDKLRVVLRRDLLTALRYRSGFALTIAGAIVELAAFFYLSRAIGPGFRPDGVDYFSFLLVGTGFYTFLVMSVNSFFSTVQEAQQTGTLEVLMTTATPPAMLVFLNALSALARNLVQLIVYVVAGLLLFRAPSQLNVVGCLLMFGFTLLIASAFGIFAAAVQLAIQKGSAVVWLLGLGSLVSYRNALSRIQPAGAPASTVPDNSDYLPARRYAARTDRRGADGTFASRYPGFEWILAHTLAPQRGRFFLDTSPGPHTRHTVLLLIWGLARSALRDLLRQHKVAFGAVAVVHSLQLADAPLLRKISACKGFGSYDS